jgi:acetylglutamate kinase
MINPEILVALEEPDLIPVIAPIGVGENGETYNINADTAAGAIAAALAARKLLMLTDVPGVLDKDKELINELSVSEARKLIKDGTIAGGMIPKVETCIMAVEHHTEAAHILDGRIPHVLLLEIFTEMGAGTMLHAV